MRLEVVTETSDFRELRSEWNRLLMTSGNASLPLSHEWLYAWWQVFGANRQLKIVCVYTEDQLVAIVPFVNERIRYRGIPADVQSLMTNGHSPYCDAIIDNNVSADQKNEILELITRCDSTDILQFNKIPEDSAVVAFLAKKAADDKICCGITPSLTTPVIAITGEWTEFYAGKSRKFRGSLNSKLNRFNKEDDFTISCENIASRNNPYLEEMVEISKQSWKKKIKNDLGSNTAGREFLLTLADVFGPGGNVNLWILHKSGVPVAYEYHLDFQSVVYPVRADFSEAFRAFSPGSVLEYTALKNLFDEQKAREYYSCADDYQYLSNWSKEVKNHLNVDLFARGWKAQFLYVLEYKIIPKFRLLIERLSEAKSRVLKRPG